MTAPSTPINAVEYQTSTPGTTWTPDASYAVGAESDRVLFVAIQAEDAGNAVASAVDFNSGEGLTKVGDIAEGINYGALWALAAPSNATGAVAITFDLDPDDVTAIIWYHSGSEQVVPSEGVATNSNSGLTETAISVDVVTVGADRMIVTAGGHGDSNAMAAGSGETLIHTIDAGTTTQGSASYFMLDASGTRAMDYTFSESRRPNIIGVAIRPLMQTTVLRRRREDAHAY